MAAPARPLTERERQVLDLVTRPQGSRKAASAELGIGKSAVDEHLTIAFRKLGVQSIGEAARKLGQAERHGQNRAERHRAKAQVAASG